MSVMRLQLRYPIDFEATPPIFQNEKGIHRFATTRQRGFAGIPKEKSGNDPIPNALSLQRTSIVDTFRIDQLNHQHHPARL